MTYDAPQQVARSGEESQPPDETVVAAEPDEAREPGAQEVPPGYAAAGERGWAMAAHAGGAVGAVVSAGILGWVIPLVVALVKKQSTVVHTHAVEALNFHLTWLPAIGGTWALGLCTSWMCLGDLYFVVAGGLVLFTAFFGFLGTVVARQGEVPRYPASFRLIR